MSGNRKLITCKLLLVVDPRSRQHVLAIPQQFSILLPLGPGPLRVSAMLCIRLPDALDSFCCFRSGTQSSVKPTTSVYHRVTLARCPAPSPRAAPCAFVKSPADFRSSTDRAACHGAMASASLLTPTRSDLRCAYRSYNCLSALMDMDVLHRHPLLARLTRGIRIEKGPGR